LLLILDKQLILELVKVSVAVLNRAPNELIPIFLAWDDIMLDVSWDPVLIAISFLVAFIASFVALDSAG